MLREIVGIRITVQTDSESRETGILKNDLVRLTRQGSQKRAGLDSCGFPRVYLLSEKQVHGFSACALFFVTVQTVYDKVQGIL